MKHILKCGCGAYTLKEQCSVCSGKAVSPRPPKYSPEDRYGKYRRQAKESELKERGAL